MICSDEAEIEGCEQRPFALWKETGEGRWSGQFKLLGLELLYRHGLVGKHRARAGHPRSPAKATRRLRHIN